MIAAGPQIGVPIATCGPIARAVLADPGEVRVIAAFERCCYLACPRGIVCIGADGIGHGPINVEIVLTRPWSTLGINEDAIGLSGDGRIAIEDRLTFDATAGATWHPPAMTAFSPPETVAGLAALRAGAAGRIPGDGLASLAFAPLDTKANRTARAAAEPVRALSEALAGTLPPSARRQQLTRAATLLLGLGPGFTPSGDDLLGGVMLALTATGRESIRDGLWLAIEPELGDLTTPPSAMHLSAAADGMAVEPVHVLLNAILLGEPTAVAQHLDAAVELGHTSGWDIVAGLTIALTALTST